MKNIAKIISVTIFVAVLAIVGVFTYHSLFGRSKAASNKPSFDVPKLNPNLSRPSTGLKGLKEPAVSEEAPLTQGNLMQELEKTVDDDGASALQELRTQSAGL